MLKNLQSNKRHELEKKALRLELADLKKSIGEEKKIEVKKCEDCQKNKERHEQEKKALTKELADL